MNRKSKIRFVVLLVLFCSAIFSFFVLCKEQRKGILTVAFLNVGQGDAIFIQAPNGNQMLIDGGPGKSVLRELSAVMPFYDRSIDVILATHADQDHVGGLPDVFKKYKVNVFIEPGVSGESSSYQELEKIVANKNSSTNEVEIKKILAKRGMNIDLGGGVILQILFPDRNLVVTETNTSSIVAKLVYGENEFLLTGDSPKTIEEYLVSFGNLQSDVLKVAHHGSKNSDDENFVSAVSPKYAVISVGQDNKYGHPNEETLKTLNNLGIKILRTDELGRIIFESDGVNLVAK